MTLEGETLMKAAILKRVGEMEVMEFERPRVVSGGLLVEVGASGICHTDVKMYRKGHRDLKLPRILGHEVSGTIVEVGRGVEEYFDVGVRVQIAPGVVCGMCHYCLMDAPNMCDRMRIIGFHLDGGFAEYIWVPHSAVRSGCVNLLPPSLSFEVASLVELLACCINSQRLVRVGLKDVVVVIGCGPAGVLQAKLARFFGAESVIVIEKDPKRVKMAKQVVREADMVVNSSSEDPLEVVASVTDGRGADVVIIACSNGNAQLQGLEMLAKRGRLSMFSGLPSETPVISLNSNEIHYTEAQIIGAYGCTSLQNHQAIGLLGSGKIDASGLITHRFKLDDILDGFRVIEFKKGLKAVIKTQT